MNHINDFEFVNQLIISREAVSHIGFQNEPDPMELYKQLKDKNNGFLLESADRCGEIGRYSLLGVHPILELKSRGENIELRYKESGTSSVENYVGSPFDYMEQLLQKPTHGYSKNESNENNDNMEVPFSSGGLAGWVGYDAVRHIEKIANTIEDKADVDDVHLMLPRHLIVIDREKRQILLITFNLENKNNLLKQSSSHSDICEKIEKLMEQDKAHVSEQVENQRNHQTPEDLSKAWSSQLSKEAFIKNVYTAKKHISNGDVFQLVFSRRLSKPTQISALELYKQLRLMNPSPYMFIVSTEDVDVVGASPETMVHLKNCKAVIHPIAGTRPRGFTEEEDKRHESDLIKDIKENAEHLMLVDLARNDLGRISKYGSVTVPKFKEIERFSHVMHIVSEVTGEVKTNMNSIEVFKACFPAGTVSGAPKIRAMSIIDENEPLKRGVYAGAVGWFATNNEMDTCIAIRTAVLKEGVVSVQAGGGLVQDSDPEAEYMETLHKSASVMRAVQMAEQSKEERKGV